LPLVQIPLAQSLASEQLLPTGQGRLHGLHTFVTQFVRPGPNTLTVEVANTWLNRLIHDDGLPAEERLTGTNLRGPGGGRRWRDVAPRAAGLLGPVRLEFPAPTTVPLATEAVP
jgi:hypothetical protein